MRLYTFVHNREQHVGIELDGRIVDLNSAHAARMGKRGAVLADSMLALIRRGPAAWKYAHLALTYAARNRKLAARWTYDRSEIELAAPIPRPGKILCSGINYRSHGDENPNTRHLEDPRFFIKAPSAVIGPGEAILWPGAKYQIDYEVELAVVIGQTARRLTRDNAMAHVFGYTILHDVTARWIQFKEMNEGMGKNFDTFAPMGPCIVTADEIPDPAKLRLTLRLNGELMQDRTNADWCFPLPRMLEWLTMAMTLEPGDVVTTGTPPGIGCFRQPQVYLKPGDVCELEISGIGRLTNPVVRDDYSFMPAFSDHIVPMPRSA